MARTTLLAILIAALWAVAPAQAATLPESLVTTATTAVQQAPAGTVTTVRETAAAATAPVRPVVERSASSAPAAAQVTTAVSEAAQASEYGTARATGTLQDGPAKASGAAAPAKRLRAAVHERPARTAPVGGPAASDFSASSREPRGVQGRASRGGAFAALPQRRPADPDPIRTTSGGAAAASAAAGFAGGAVALLLFGFSLAGPRLRRRLAVRPVVVRPVAFVSLLERPG